MGHMIKISVPRDMPCSILPRDNGLLRFWDGDVALKVAPITAAIDAAIKYDSKHLAEAEAVLALPHHEDAAEAAKMAAFAAASIEELKRIRTLVFVARGFTCNEATASKIFAHYQPS